MFNSEDSIKRGLSLQFKNDSTGWWVNLFIAGFLIGGFGVGITSWNSTQDFLEAAETTTGEVIEFHESRSDGDTYFQPIVRFETLGREFTFTDVVKNRTPAYYPGELVEVLFHPGNVENARINSFNALYLMPLVGFGIGLAGLAMLVTVQVRKRKRKALVQHLLKNGRRVTTQFTNVHTIVKAKQQRKKYIIKTELEVNNTNYGFRSAELSFDPREDLEGHTLIDVLVDPEDYSSYIMDTSFLE